MTLGKCVSRHLVVLATTWAMSVASSFAEDTGPLPARLPDGDIARLEIDGTRISAWYGSPTTRYQHAILGDAVEAGTLHVQINDGPVHPLALPENQVFEDRTPRLADLNGDGDIEILTIRSFQQTGASVAVFGLRDAQLKELAASDPIGRANRWLNIAGIADFAGLGRPQIAFVETPHIGGTLYFSDWQGDKLVPIASMPGFSNHKIGSRAQDLTAILEYNKDHLPDLAVPSDDRRTLRVVGFMNGRLIELANKRLSFEIERRISPANPKPDCADFVLVGGTTFAVCAGK